MSHTFDAVVVGAGTAGATCAFHLARRGLRTALVDARPLDEAGARWVNYVPAAHFEAAGLALPEGEELRSRPAPMTMVLGAARVKIEDSPCLGVDMRALVGRLQGLCADAGVVALGHTRILGVRLANGRPVALETTRGELRAGLFVDASGLNGALRRRVPALAADCPTVERKHLCSAAQEVRLVRDPEAAGRFMERNGLAADHVLSHPAVAGGYSVINVSVDAERRHADVLTGCIVGEGFSGPDLLNRAVREHGFLGDRLFGGAGTIPLRRPYDRLSAPGIALIGNAGCQVFPAHGSGIGMGLIAARMLAEGVSQGGDPGGEARLWAWQAAFQREHGVTLAVYDLFRRLNQSMNARECEHMLHSGLVNPKQMAIGLHQKLPKVRLGETRGFARLLASNPRLAAHAARRMAAMPAVVALYRAYPVEPSRRALRAFSRAVAMCFREAPDLSA